MEHGCSKRDIPLRLESRSGDWEMPPGRSAGRSRMLWGQLKLAVEWGGQAGSRGSSIQNGAEVS